MSKLCFFILWGVTLKGIAVAAAVCTGLDPAWAVSARAWLQHLQAKNIEIVIGNASPHEATLIFLGQPHETGLEAFYSAEDLKRAAPDVFEGYWNLTKIVRSVSNQKPTLVLMEERKRRLDLLQPRDENELLSPLVRDHIFFNGWDHPLLQQRSEVYRPTSPESYWLSHMRTIHMIEHVIERARQGKFQKIVITAGSSHMDGSDGYSLKMLNDSGIPFLVLTEPGRRERSEEFGKQMKDYDQTLIHSETDAAIKKAKDPFRLRYVPSNFSGPK